MNNPNKVIVHFKPFNDNMNVKCLNGSYNIIRTTDKTKVTCPICLIKNSDENFWFAHEQKHGNVNKNF